MPHNGSATSLPPILSPAEKLTSAVFLTCGPMTSNPSRNATFSRASVDGPMPSDLQDGPMKDLFGQEVVHANRLARPANAKASTTTATSGLLSDSLSPSDDLQRSLESRLRARLNGSDLCEVIWKIWTTPWGQSLSKPRARVRITSATDTGLWATIRASDGEKGGPNMQFGAGGTPLLAMAAWPTIRANKLGPPDSHGNLAMWATATAHERTHTPRKVHHGQQLANQAVEAATWPKTIPLSGQSEPTEKRGALNPEFVCWLMGYPTVWLSCAGSETPSTRARRRNS